MAIPAFSSVTGWSAPTFDECLAFVLGAYAAETGIVIDPNGPSSPQLAWLRSLARAMKAQYDDLGGSYGGKFVGSAGGLQLQNLLFPFIGGFQPAVASQVVLPLTGTPLTAIPANSSVLLDIDGAGATPWTITGATALDGLGNGVGTFTYGATGAKAAGIGETWTINTPVTGWATAGPNTIAALEGREAETDLQYRTRYSLSAQGTRLLAAVLAVPGVTTATVFENKTDVPDAFWGLTHWIELLVQGGVAADIGQAIHDNRAETVNTVGGVVVGVVDTGFTSPTERYSLPSLIDVWTEVTIVKGELYSSDTSAAAVTAREQAIRDAIMAWAATRPVGLDVTGFQVSLVAAGAVVGVSTAAATVDIVNPPLTSGVVAEPRDLLVFDPARILLVGV